MKTAVCLAFVLVAVSIAVGAKDGKLRIGVKKRADSCTIKTRKGDTLTMHYTVSLLPKHAERVLQPR